MFDVVGVCLLCCLVGVWCVFDMLFAVCLVYLSVCWCVFVFFGWCLMCCLVYCLMCDFDVFEEFMKCVCFQNGFVEFLFCRIFPQRRINNIYFQLPRQRIQHLPKI